MPSQVMITTQLFFAKGNVYAGSFWNKITFCNLGVSDVSSEKLSEELQEYVSLLYGVKGESVNEARYDIFDRTFSKEKKITDISLLPPCQQTLELHILRACFIAREWRSADINDYESRNSVDGWNEQMEPKWVETMMPEDVQELFIDNKYEDFSD